MAKYLSGQLLVVPGNEGDRKLNHSIMPVSEVLSVGSMFYTLSGFPRSRRQKTESVEASCIAVPSDIPWRFPDQFSCFCYCARAVYRSRLLCVDEVGHPIPRKFKRIETIENYFYEFPTECGFKTHGYAIRELRLTKADDGERWKWANSSFEALRVLKAFAQNTENHLGGRNQVFPERLAEEDRTKWSLGRTQIDMRVLRRGDVLCKHSGHQITFYRFEKITRGGKVASLEGSLLDPSDLIAPPSAFPPTVLAETGSYSFFLSIGISEIRAIYRRHREGEQLGSASDLPGGSSLGAISAILGHSAALYFTNDNIHWWAKLSDVLEFEMDRLKHSARKHGDRIL